MCFCILNHTLCVIRTMFTVFRFHTGVSTADRTTFIDIWTLPIIPTLLLTFYTKVLDITLSWTFPTFVNIGVGQKQT